MQTHQTWQDSTRHGQRDIGGLVAHAQRKHRQQLAMSHCCTTIKHIHKLNLNSTDWSSAFVLFYQYLAMSCFHHHDVIELAQVSFLIIKHFINTTTKLNKKTHTCLMASFPQPLLLTTTTTVLWPFVQDYPGELGPEETFTWKTLWGPMYSNYIKLRGKPVDWSVLSDCSFSDEIRYL